MLYLYAYTCVIVVNAICLLIKSYRVNTQIRSCIKLHAGGPSLASSLAAYRIQCRLHGVAMSIGPCSDLPNRPLSICIEFSKETLSSLIGAGVALSPVRPYHYHAEPRLFCCGPDGMEQPPSCAAPPTKESRTLSDTFYNQLKTVLFDRAGAGSTSE